jgi:hypothetical protein
MVGNWVEEEKTKSFNESNQDKNSNSLQNILNKAEKKAKKLTEEEAKCEEVVEDMNEREFELMNCVEMIELENMYRMEIKK